MQLIYKSFIQAVFLKRKKEKKKKSNQLRSEYKEKNTE